MLTLLLLSLFVFSIHRAKDRAKGNYIFYDDFDTGLTQWNNFGSPTPATFQDPSFKDGWGYSTEGDGWYDSGSWSKQLIDISNGIIIEFRVKQEAGDIWDEFDGIGIGRIQSGYRENHIPYYFQVGIEGRNPDANPQSTDDILYTVFVDEHTVRQYIEDAANDHAFHVFKIVYDGSTNYVDFYRDNNLIATLEAGPRPYDELPLLIWGRDYHDTNYLDWIRVSPLQRPEHDIAVTDLQVPKFLTPEESALINVIIENKGLNNETSINVNFKVNSTLIDSIVIPSLENGASTEVVFSWTAPTTEGTYVLRVETTPVPDENIMKNNFLEKAVQVTTRIIRVYHLSHTPIIMHGDEKYLYYTIDTGGIYRVNRNTGVEELLFDRGRDLVFAEGNYLYVGDCGYWTGTHQTSIWKLDKTTGAVLWSVTSYSWNSYSMAVGKYAIYARGARDGSARILKENGTIQWVSHGVTRYLDDALPDLKNDVLIEAGWWSPNTVQRVSKVDGGIIWQRKGPTEEMGEVTRPIDVTDDAIWIQWFKGTYPNQSFYALAKWDRDTGALIEAFPEKPYDRIWHLGPEGSLIFDYPDESGNALVYNPETKEISKINSQTWEVYWTTNWGYPMMYVVESPERPFIDDEYIYLRDKNDPKIIYQYQWTTTTKDNIPPKTTLTIGKPKYIGDITYVTPETPFSLNVTDNPGGAGVALTAYRIRNATYETGWIPYTRPFHLKELSDGIYAIDFNSTDNANNMEPTNTINVSLFSWSCVFIDGYGRKTMLKINLAHKFFQLITPDKDYGIRKALYMQECGGIITIKHHDNELRLTTLAMDTKLDLCIATIWDLQNGKCYFLLDVAGTEKNGGKFRSFREVLFR